MNMEWSFGLLQLILCIASIYFGIRAYLELKGTDVTKSLRSLSTIKCQALLGACFIARLVNLLLMRFHETLEIIEIIALFVAVECILLALVVQYGRCYRHLRK
jgi:hypothetical protein